MNNKTSAAVLVIATMLAGAAYAQGQYPMKPVRIIVPGAPGISADIITRLISQPLAERLGQQVLVDNRAGASTMIGAEAVARSAPDGYTLLMTTPALAVNPSVYKKVPYDALRDFAPITQPYNQPNLLIVHPSL